jgi:hypothetical protein
MFTFFWVSNSGGPLHYLSLAFILLQVILPLWMNTTDVRIVTGLYDHNIMPLLVFIGLPIFVSGYHHVRPHLIRLVPPSNTDRNTAAAAASNRNVSRLLPSLVSSSSLPSAVIMFVGFCLISSWAFLFIMSQEEKGFLSSLVLWIHSAFFLVMLAMFLKDVSYNGPANRQESSSSSSWDACTLSSIVDNIRQFPIEEYMSEEAVRKSCTISELKRMLQNRNCYKDKIWTERSDLVEALEQNRKYNDTCCICAEEYQRGDSLRILPRCLHEFHVECIDQWAYTFASKKKQHGQGVQPSCPLCKTTLA